jgi:hypothetical protein
VRVTRPAAFEIDGRHPERALEAGIELAQRIQRFVFQQIRGGRLRRSRNREQEQHGGLLHLAPMLSRSCPNSWRKVNSLYHGFSETG